jgi:hypothetical protein
VEAWRERLHAEELNGFAFAFGKSCRQAAPPRPPFGAGGVAAPRHGMIDHAVGQLDPAPPPISVFASGDDAICAVCRAVEASAA